jgi:hypothetical protein
MHGRCRERSGTFFFGPPGARRGRAGDACLEGADSGSASDHALPGILAGPAGMACLHVESGASARFAAGERSATAWSTAEQHRPRRAGRRSRGWRSAEGGQIPRAAARDARYEAASGVRERRSSTGSRPATLRPTRSRRSSTGSSPRRAVERFWEWSPRSGRLIRPLPQK